VLELEVVPPDGPRVGARYGDVDDDRRIAARRTPDPGASPPIQGKPTVAAEAADLP
jgi:hypothetical protein